MSPSPHPDGRAGIDAALVKPLITSQFPRWSGLSVTPVEVALGLILLTALANGTSVSTAIITGAVVLAMAAPLYLPAAMAERRQPLVVTPSA